MVARHVAIALRVKADVAVQFVGMKLAARLHVGGHERLQGGAALVRNNCRHNVATTLQRADDNGFASGSAHMRSALDAADQSFVNLDGLTRPADRLVAVNRRHVLADKRCHAPRGFIGHSKLALEFLGADAVARRREQVDCIEPKLERGARLLERSANGRVQMVTAPLAGISALGLDAIPVRRALA